MTGYCLHVVSKNYQHEFEPILYRGVNSEITGRQFIKDLEQLNTRIQNVLGLPTTGTTVSCSIPKVFNFNVD